MRLTRWAAMVTAIVAALVVLPEASAQSAGCSWPIKADGQTRNVAYPDTSSTYWVRPLAGVPGRRLVIQGRYPRARYFSLHVYDGAEGPIGSLADHEIEPDPGAANPFRDRGAEPGGTYTVSVEFRPESGKPTANTLYAQDSAPGEASPVALLIYRVYVPDDPASPSGGVPLPDISTDAVGGTAGLPLDRCGPLGSSGGPAPGGLGGSVDLPGAALPLPGASDPPEAQRDYSTSFLRNQHVGYLKIALTRRFGELAVVRFKAPTFPDTRAGEPVTPARQLRFWSLCQNEPFTSRVVACTPDHQTLLDDDGVATFVISDPADRPANATREQRVNWLPWASSRDGALLLYRHMLPDAGFAEAVQNIPEGTPAAQVMGAYSPVAAYCDRAAFEAGGAAACLAS